MIIATDFIAVTTTRDAINIQRKNRDRHTLTGKNGTFENRQSASRIHTTQSREKKKLYLKSQAIAQTTNNFFVFVFAAVNCE